MFKSVSKIRATWFFLKSIGLTLFTLGLALWFGGIAFLGYGVAPVNFYMAESWELTGQNPALPNQKVTYRTVGGALTGKSIQRLNDIEMVSAVMMTVGLLFLWVPRNNRDKWLMAQTVALSGSILLLMIYSFNVGEELFELQATEPIDFSVRDPDQQSAVHQRFNELHDRYSNLTKVNMMLLLSQFFFLAFQTASQKMRTLNFARLTRLEEDTEEE